MSNSESKKQRQPELVALVIIAMIFVVVLCLLFTNQEIHISNIGTEHTFNALYCTSFHYKNAFFAIDNEVNSKHEIKLIYQNEKAYKMSLTYTSDFETESSANNASAILHAKYNHYMGQRNLSPTILSPTFSVINNSLKINLFTDISNIDAITGSLFFLSPSEAIGISKRTPEEIQEFYAKKGFNCVITKQNSKEENE